VKVYTGIDYLPTIKNPVVTTGTFDGVHLGHQQIIERLKELAKGIEGETVLITFFPHPRQVLYPKEHGIKLLNTKEEKIELLSKAGINNLIIIPFTIEFSQMTSVDFIKKVLVEKLQTKRLVIGYDHHFGRNREGSFEHLKASGPVYGFTVEEIPAKDIDHVAISSTRIRTALETGDIKTANQHLGYNYFITGKVTKGEQLGRQLGFPTANIFIEEDYKLIPADGVYAVKVDVNSKQFEGMLNIGYRPTVDGIKHSIEVNIFNLESDIYDETIRVYFFQRLRNEKKFSSVDNLKAQLKIDKQQTQEFFEKNN